MSWFSRLKNGWNSRRLDEDLADEIRDHIERRTADLRQRGMSDSDSRRRAERTFGVITENKRRARLYRINQVGLKQLAGEKKSWSRFSTGVDRVLRYA